MGEKTGGEATADMSKTAVNDLVYIAPDANGVVSSTHAHDHGRSCAQRMMVCHTAGATIAR